MTAHLRLIDGGKPKPRGKRPWPGCHVCEVDIGVRSKMLVRGVSHPDQTARGQITGGTKTLVCAMCLARGKYTPVTA